MSVEEQGVFGAKIVAKTRREAAKLYGLILHDCGKLRALGPHVLFKWKKLATLLADKAFARGLLGTKFTSSVLFQAGG